VNPGSGRRIKQHVKPERSITLARYTGPVCRICRREGLKLFLKGERCYTKCAFERRSYAPGQHGQARKKVTPYGIQLREKQKLRKTYGINEKQFKTFFIKATKQKGVAGINFLRLLERRLDNVVYRLGFATSRSHARQIVSHGLVLVDGRKCNIPSYIVEPNQELEIKEKVKQEVDIQRAVEYYKGQSPPSWLEVDAEHLKARILNVPSEDDLRTYVKDLYRINEQYIVEFYSR
jgi:small subunit ribosomal protein S4